MITWAGVEQSSPLISSSSFASDRLEALAIVIAPNSLDVVLRSLNSWSGLHLPVKQVYAF